MSTAFYPPLPETVSFWVEKIAPNIPEGATDFVEFRCGLGDYTRALAARLNARGAGVAGSPGALTAARQGGGGTVDFVLDAAGAVPLPDSSCDFAFLQNAPPGLDLVKLTAEARRLLRPGGVFVLTTPTLDGNPRVQQGGVFPGYRGAMIGRMQTWAALREAFAASAFVETNHMLVSEPVMVLWNDAEELDALYADPLFAPMERARFDDGIAQLKAGAKPDSIGCRIVVPVDLFVWRRADA